MPTYKFECECGNCEFIIKKISERDNVVKCKKCGKNMKRAFTANRNQLVLWRHKGEHGLTAQGPTRRCNYKVKDVAKENGWFDK